jgi:hypothetical protein
MQASGAAKTGVMQCGAAIIRGNGFFERKNDPATMGAVIGHIPCSRKRELPGT